jgi:hypothetical protein
MSESDVPQVITRSARSMAAKKRWDKKRQEPKEHQKEQSMNWFQKHIDAITIIAAIAAGVWVVSSKINETHIELSREIHHVRSDLSKVNAEVIKIQTVLIIKGIAPKEIFAAEDKQ